MQVCLLFESICLTPDVSLLNVLCSEQQAGNPLKLSRQNAMGMTKEIALAAQAPEWEAAMVEFIDKRKGVHQDVVDFCSAGDAPPDLTQNSFMASFGNKEEQELETTHFGLFMVAPDVVKPCMSGSAEFIAADAQWTHRVNASTVEAFSNHTNTIDVSWSWGMKFCFKQLHCRRAALRLRRLTIGVFGHLPNL
jgi:hypothetical protein